MADGVDCTCLMPSGRPTKKPKAVPVPSSSATSRIVPVTNVSSDQHGNTCITTHSHVVAPGPPSPDEPRYNPLDDSMQNKMLDGGNNTDTVSLRIFIVYLATLYLICCAV